MGLKDRLFESFALPLINRSFLAPYGQARAIQLDSDKKTAQILLDLKGEREPLHVIVGRYEFFRRGEDTYVTLHGIETSREWMTELAERNVAGRAVKLPREFAGVIARIM